MLVHCEGIVLPDGQVRVETGCKYLGVLEGVDVMQKGMKEKIKKEYLSRVKQVARLKLYSMVGI